MPGSCSLCLCYSSSCYFADHLFRIMTSRFTQFARNRYAWAQENNDCTVQHNTMNTVLSRLKCKGSPVCRTQNSFRLRKLHVHRATAIGIILRCTHKRTHGLILRRMISWPLLLWLFDYVYRDCTSSRMDSVAECCTLLCVHICVSESVAHDDATCALCAPCNARPRIRDGITGYL